MIFNQQRSLKAGSEPLHLFSFARSRLKRPLSWLSEGMQRLQAPSYNIAMMTSSRRSPKAHNFTEPSDGGAMLRPAGRASLG